MKIYYENKQQFYEQKKKSFSKFYLGCFAIGLLSIFGFYAVAYSPVFTIRDFTISGASRFDKETIVNSLQPLILNNKIKNFLGIKNLLVWNQEVDVSGTAFLEANIKRHWLHQSVAIEVKERNQFAIWCRAGNCYWIDENGMAFEEAPETEGSLILTINDDGKEGIALGQKVVEERLSDNLSAIFNGILDLNVRIKKIFYTTKLQEMNVELNDGPDLYFSLRFNPALNLEAIKSLREKVGLRGMSYVDLRVENRIYYK